MVDSVISGSRPNLFVVGAMKSGSTFLHQQLSAHPDIFMSTFKEPSYFLNDEELARVSPRLAAAGRYRQREEYLSLFAEGSQARFRGESSTAYTKQPLVGNVAERIAELSPDARIIYMMREPLARSISHYWHQVSWNNETRKPLDAVKADPQYASVSHYAMQLKPYLDQFGPDQISIMTLEAFKADPERQLRELFQWLGVDPDFVPGDADQKRNETPQHVKAGGVLAILGRLRHSRYYKSLGPLVPAPLRRLAKGLAERKIDRSAVDMAPLRAYLGDLQKTQLQELKDMLQREFPEWERSNGS